MMEIFLGGVCAGIFLTVFGIVIVIDWLGR